MGIAFFDMDKTLLRASSGLLYVRYLARRHKINSIEMVSVLLISAQYSLNFLNFPKTMARMSQHIKGGNAQDTKTLCDLWFDECLVHYIAPLALERLHQHQTRGDYVYMLSASTQFAVEPLARFLDVPYRCTQLEVIDNHFTGRIAGIHCYAEGKAYWGEQVASQHAVSLNDCTFYTDSYSDRILLEKVGHPVAVNPDRKLAALARTNNWAIEHFY